MAMNISRLASVLVAIGYVIVALVTAEIGQEYAAVILAFVLLLPMALIWFPDVLGDYLGPVRGGFIDHQTPPLMVAIAGWFFLVGMPLIVYQFWRSRA